MVKVFLIIPSLVAGGAEKVMAYLAQNIDRNNFTVNLIVIGKKDNISYDISNIDTTFLGHEKVRNSVFSLAKIIRKEKPDIIMGTIAHVNLFLGLLSYFFKKIVFIGRETTVASVQNSLRSKKSFKSILLKKISNIAYNGLNKIVSQSNDMKNDLISFKEISTEKIVVINNPVSSNFETKIKIADYSNCFQFVTVGRLTKQKGHERILKALSTIQNPYVYTMIGDGTERENLLELASSLGISLKVKHIPFTKNVSQYLIQSHVYLQGSYVEGFPNALIESLAVGTPAVVFNALGGMNEIIKPKENGFIVDNTDEFQKRIIELIENLQSYPPNQVSSWVKNQYNSETILTQYEVLFKSLT